MCLGCLLILHHIEETLYSVFTVTVIDRQEISNLH